jgi:hypothetical protein
MSRPPPYITAYIPTNCLPLLRIDASLSESSSDLGQLPVNSNNAYIHSWMLVYTIVHYCASPFASIQACTDISPRTYFTANQKPSCLYIALHLYRLCCQSGFTREVGNKEARGQEVKHGP